MLPVLIGATRWPSRGRAMASLSTPSNFQASLRSRSAELQMVSRSLSRNFGTAHSVSCKTSCRASEGLLNRAPAAPRPNTACTTRAPASAVAVAMMRRPCALIPTTNAAREFLPGRRANITTSAILSAAPGPLNTMEFANSSALLSREIPHRVPNRASRGRLCSAGVCGPSISWASAASA